MPHEQICGAFYELKGLFNENVPQMYFLIDLIRKEDSFVSVQKCCGKDTMTQELLCPTCFQSVATSFLKLSIQYSYVFLYFSTMKNILYFLIEVTPLTVSWF